MNYTKHISFLMQAIIGWVLFWLAGLPHYYQQYSLPVMGIGCTLLSVVISLAAIFVLGRGRPETRVSRAFWISFYFTLPFAFLDTLYCGVYLGLGASYLISYWYLTLFYFTPWLTFLPTAWLLNRK
jgi:hypothetical protein